MKKTIKNSLKKDYTIGFLCGTFYEPYQAAIFKAIVAACEEMGVNVVIFPGGTLQSRHYDWARRNSIYELVTPRNINGIIALSGTLCNNITIDELLRFYSQFSGIPFVSIGVEIKGMPSLLVDNENGMKDLIVHLIEVHGSKRIAFIRGTEGNFDAELRFSVYKKMLKKYRIPYDPDLVIAGDFFALAGSRAVSLLLDERNVRFDALVSSNDRMAFNAIEALKKRGYRVPEDIPVTGFDDIPMSRCFLPPLTTVSQPFVSIGREAVQMIISRLDGRNPPGKRILHTELIVRDSCGCLEKNWKLNNDTIIRRKGRGGSEFTREESFMNDVLKAAGDYRIPPEISKKEMIDWLHLLIKAIEDGMGEKDFSGFAHLLNTIFNEFRNRKQDLGSWRHIINSLFDYIKESIQPDHDREIVEILRKNTFELLSETIMRSKEYDNKKFQEQSVDFHRITQEIFSDFRQDAIKKVITEKIPNAGFKNFYISLYKKDGKNGIDKEYARMVIASYNNKQANSEENTGYYPSVDIIPGTLKNIAGRHTFVIMSINFKKELLGFGVFEHGPGNLLLYENLVEQLSGALKEISLMEQKEHHARELEHEMQVSVSALKETTHQLEKERDERIKTEEALLIAQEQALVTLKSIGDGVITTDTKGIITYLNPVAEELTGWRNSEAVGKPLSKVFNVVYRFSDKRVEHPVDIALGQDRGFKISGSIVLNSRDFREYEIEEMISPIRNFNNNVIGAVLVIRNVSETQKMSRELSFQRTHDQLTGLLNRIRFEELLKDVLDELLKERNEHCLCFLDIDSFRIINDACGHAAGDECIKNIGLILKGCVRHADILARLGGDQFGLLLISCPCNQARQVAEHILHTVNGYTFNWKGINYRVRISIGIVYIDSYSDNISRALTAANFSCQLAKRKGGNQFHLYHADDEASIKYQSEMHFIPYITKAIKEDRFCLYKQVIRPIGYGVPANDHYEVLIRMKDDDGNIITPSVFLHVAERYNLMPEIDRWVIEKLFSSYKVDYYETPDKAYAKYSINISGMTLNDEKFLNFVIDKLNEYKIPPYMLCFEITETAAISNFTQVILFIKELKRIGCFFSLDDFGSGWASFNYLKVLPVDFLKIEGSFVREISRNMLDYVLVQTMNHIGHVIGLKTIAEYVENDEILDKLKRIGVDYAQGFGIAKPDPLLF